MSGTYAASTQVMTTVYRAQQCSWCGHPLHLTGPCPGHIQTGTDKQPTPQPCPCARPKETPHETPHQ